MKSFQFTKINYIIIAVSVLIITVGFILMYGSTTDVEYNPDVFSTRRITVAPIVCMIGYAVTIVGILWKDKNKKAE